MIINYMGQQMSIVPLVFLLTIVKAKGNQVILTKLQVQTVHFPSSCCTCIGDLSPEHTHISFSITPSFYFFLFPSCLLVSFHFGREELQEESVQ